MQVLCVCVPKAGTTEQKSREQRQWISKLSVRYRQMTQVTQDVISTNCEHGSSDYLRMFAPQTFQGMCVCCESIPEPTRTLTSLPRQFLDDSADAARQLTNFSRSASRTS
jgi:hypothetical protein